MAYYCFLCNEDHEDSMTEEHFIPRSIDGPNSQYLHVCETSNARSNTVFDNDVRDILFMARHQKTRVLKRTGEALLSDGTLEQYKFSYDDSKPLSSTRDAFQYFFDLDTNKHIPSKDVYAIKFSAGLNQDEQLKFCRGLAKISIGSLAYLLKKEGISDDTIKQIFSQESIDSIRHIALKLNWTGNSVYHRFSLGRTDIISVLQGSCSNTSTSNHVVQISFQKDNTIQIRGMLYSKYGWQLDLPNNISIGLSDLRLENEISNVTSNPENQRDLTMSLDSIVLVNPDYEGEKPDIPEYWENREV